MLGKHKRVGVTSTSLTAYSHISEHGGPQVGNGWTSNRSHKPTQMVTQGRATPNAGTRSRLRLRRGL
jgi:hypothetical protein